MFFLVSKILYLVTRPSTLFVLLLLAGLLLRRFGSGRFRAVGTLSTGAGLAILFVATLTPLPGALVWWLEARFPSGVTADMPTPAGIIVLGGGTDGRMEEIHGKPKFLEGAEAILEAARLAKRWPGVPVILTGSGSGDIGEDGTDYTEAGSMARLLKESGVEEGRLILERRARTTWENASLSRDMVRPEPGARWILVTQAWHMPRSIGAFRAAGWSGIVAHPAAWETGERPRLRPAFGDGLVHLDLGVKEVLGLIGYRAVGRSSALVPAP